MSSLAAVLLLFPLAAHADTCSPIDVQGDITCSSDLAGTTETGTDLLSAYSGGTCSNIPQGGPEVIYTFEPQNTGAVTFRIDGMQVDKDIYVLQGDCDSTSCLKSSIASGTSTDAVTFTAVTGTTYYVIVEGYSQGAAGTNGFSLHFDDGSGGCLEDCDNGLDDDSDGNADCADSDCASEPLCQCDLDNDGYSAISCGGSDCDDADDRVHPNAVDVPYDGVDDDCDGADLCDVDGDGFDAVECAGADCADLDGQVHPDAVEVPRDGIDNDCLDGDVCDADGDGVVALAAVCGGQDCDDDDASVLPGAVDIEFDGIDQDCDGADAGNCDADADGVSALACGGPDCDDTDALVLPEAIEVPYDGIDNDCTDGDLCDVDGDGFEARLQASAESSTHP